MVRSVWGDARLVHEIWIFDSDHGTRKVLRSHLERAGYRVRGFLSLAYLEAELAEASVKPDMILIEPYCEAESEVTDAHIALVRKIKHELPEPWSQVGVFAVTSLIEDPRVWPSGVDGYYTKPFNPKDLLRFIGRYLASLTPQSGSADK